MSKASTAINNLSNIVNNSSSSELNDILRSIVKVLNILDEEIQTLKRKPQR